MNRAPTLRSPFGERDYVVTRSRPYLETRLTGPVSPTP
jgi:hypothetical protein